MFNIKYGVNTCDHIHDELMVHLTYSCPNHCEFCIDKKNGPPKDDQISVRSIYKIIQEMKDKIRSVTISGGEPLMFLEQCLSLVKLIKLNCPNLKVSVITSLPRNVNIEMLFDLLDLCDSMSISIMSYNMKIRESIFGTPYSHLDNMQLVKSLVPWQEKITLSFNLIKGKFDTDADIYYNLNYFNRMGYTKFRLQELTNHEDLYVSIEDILEKKLSGSPFSDGCLKELDEVYELLGPDFSGKVLVKRACFVVCNKNKATFRDLIKAATRKLRDNTFGVVYGNGELKPYWE